MANRLTLLEFKNKDLHDELEAKVYFIYYHKNKEMIKLNSQLEIYKKKSIKDIQESYDRKVEENKALQHQI